MLLGGAALLLATNLADHTLVAGGDVNIARYAHLARDAPTGQRWLEPIAGLIRDADIALVNLECVVSSKGRFHRKPESRPYFYRARPEMLDALTRVGVDVVTTANNHTMDYGPVALREQLELLDAVGIASAGSGLDLEAALRPAYLRVDDTVVAFLGADGSVPFQRYFVARENRPGLAGFDIETDDLVETFRPVLTEARRHAHVVVVSPHWGRNWTDGPSERIRALAHGLVDAGADLILGHSAHQFHGVEVYRGKLIVYDMGSLMFDRTGQGRMRKGLLFRVAFGAAGARRLDVLPLRVRNNVTQLATGQEAEQIRMKFRELTRELDPDLEVAAGEGEWLSVRLPEPGAPRAVEPTPDVRVAGTTRHLPRRLRRRRPDVYVTELPEGLRENRPVDLGGVEYLGALLPKKVPERHDVIVELYLRAKQPPRARQVLVVSGQKQGDDCRFGELAEPGDWTVPTSQWRSGEIVRHRVALRSVSRCGPGNFDVEVELRQPRTRGEGPKAKVGILHVYPTRRRRQRLVRPRLAFPAGLPGPAVLPPPPPEPSLAPYYGAGAAGGLLAVALAVLSWRRRKRRAVPPPPPDSPPH